jgi:hypothetical protein
MCTQHPLSVHLSSPPPSAKPTLLPHGHSARQRATAYNNHQSRRLLHFQRCRIFGDLHISEAKGRDDPAVI